MDAMQEFIQKYGTKSPTLLVGEFIRRAPSFPEDGELAGELGAMMGLLQVALEEEAAKMSQVVIREN